MKTYLHSVKQVIKKIGLFFLCGFVFMWMSFWYLSGTPMGLFKYLFVYYSAQHYFYKPVDNATLFKGSLKGMVEALGEPHSMYLTPEEFQRLKEMSEAKYVGIGVIIGQKDHELMVISVIDDSPAKKAGLQAGDIITALDNKEVKDLAIGTVSSMIRGEAGTTVHIKVLRKGTPKEFSVKREEITLPTVKSSMATQDIGYIRISQFSEDTGEEFAKEYQALQKKGMKKLVLDLRENPGGLVNAAATVGSYLLPKGPIVTIKTKYGEIESYPSEGLTPPIPLVVLVDGNSASASEIIAAAVQDRKAGVVMGTKSYGKGTVQSVIPGPDGSAMKLTIAQYHTPADRVIDGKGVTPDILIEHPNSVDTYSNHDSQVQQAVSYLQHHDTK